MQIKIKWLKQQTRTRNLLKIFSLLVYGMDVVNKMIRNPKIIRVIPIYRLPDCQNVPRQKLYTKLRI